MSYSDIGNLAPNNSEKKQEELENELSNNNAMFKKKIADVEAIYFNKMIEQLNYDVVRETTSAHQLLDLEEVIRKHYSYVKDIRKTNKHISSILSYINQTYHSAQYYLSVIHQDKSNWFLNEDPSHPFNALNKEVNTITQKYLQKEQEKKLQSEFNTDISQWNVSKVTDIGNMFKDSKFNSETSSWSMATETQKKLMNVEDHGRKPGSKLKRIMELQGQSGVGKSMSIPVSDNAQITIVEPIPFFNEEKNNDNEKKIKLSLFKRLGMYLQFWKTNNKSSTIELTQEEKEQQEKIDRLITHSILPEVYRLEKSGVELSDKQKIYFDIALNKLIIDDKTEQLKEMMSEGYYPRKTLLANWIISYQDNPHLKAIFQKELKDSLVNEEVINEVMFQWNKKLSLYLSDVDKLNHENVPQFAHQKLMRITLNKEIKQMIGLFNEISSALEIDAYIQMLSKLKEINQQELKLYRSYTHNVFWKNPNDEELKEYHDAIKDSLKDEEKLLEQINYFYKNENEIKNKSFKVELANYPKEIQEQLIQLELKIEDCKKEKSNMPEHEWERLENLWATVLNKSLKSYVEMSDKHKEELLSVENKTSQQLLSETISHIDEAIEAKLLELNENRLSHLSVTQRYTQTIKKTI